MFNNRLNLQSNKNCCVIVTYNPENSIIDLIKNLINQVDLVIVVDNNSSDSNFIIEFNEKIYFIKNVANLGLAKALNQGIEIAINLGFSWVTTFDQDSKPFYNIINILLDAYNNFNDKDAIGAIGANFINNNNIIYNSKNSNSLLHKREYLITSGCMYPTSVFLKVGFFREDYFIDNVDIEFSLRLRKYNKILLIVNEPCMIHNVGFPKKFNFFCFELSTTNHNSKRRYYMAKNHVLLSKEYFLIFPFFILKINFFYFRSFLYVLFLEKDKVNKVYKSLLGLFHGVVK